MAASYGETWLAKGDQVAREHDENGLGGGSASKSRAKREHV